MAALDPTAMAGLNDQLGAMDPTAMAGFEADQLGAMDPTAMAGFKSDQVAALDPTAMAGFDATRWLPWTQQRWLVPKDQVAALIQQPWQDLNLTKVAGLAATAVSGFQKDQVGGLAATAVVDLERSKQRSILLWLGLSLTK